VPVFAYTAIDSAGKKRAGTVDARSKSSAVGLLKEQTLFVVSLEEQKESTLEKMLSFKGVPETEVVSFTRQLSTMISAGLPISRGLEVLAEQIQHKMMKKIILDTLRDVQGGATLSSAFAKYPGAFSPTYIALVKAGEASGKLEEILKRLADTLESQREFKASFKGAMIYPAIIFLAMIGVFVLMMIFVIPKLSQMYDSMGVELPVITTIMIAISGLMSTYWYLMIGGIVLLGLGFKSVMSTEEGRSFFYKVLVRAPIFGKILKQRDLTEFTRTLSLLISSGIPIVEALNIVSKVVINPSFVKGALAAATSVEKGGSLSDYLKQDKTFPPLLGQMTSVGEETGQLDEVFNRIGAYFASETDHAIKGLSAALEPVILILLGGMVGLLIVSIITPIYKITSSI
jgi:type IV pilus assembly protein PilC